MGQTPVLRGLYIGTLLTTVLSMAVSNSNTRRAMQPRRQVPGGSTRDSAAALVSLLHALKSEHRIVDPKEHGLTRKELQTRAEEISPGDWASEAVCEAIEAVMAAVIFGDNPRPAL